MLCCLIFMLLVAQVLAFFRQARRRLRAVLVDRVRLTLAGWMSFIMPRKRAVALTAVQAIGLVFVVLHWDHIKQEAASVFAGRNDVVIAGPICSSDPDVPRPRLAAEIVSGL